MPSDYIIANPSASCYIHIVIGAQQNMKHSVTLLILMTALAGAVTLHVPSEYPGMSSAISAAQDGDTVLVAPGNYCGGFSFQGKNIVVRSTAGAGSTFLHSPFPDFHCVIFTGGEDSTAVLQGFSISNVEFYSMSTGSKDPVDEGGGIYIVDSSPTIRNCIITGCWVTGSGGGVYSKNSAFQMTNCVISNNHADVYGGGLSISSSASGSPPSIVECTIIDNYTQYGGGFYLRGDTVVVINNTISNNNSSGITVSSGCNALICGNMISGNYGSGVRINSGSPTLIGNIIVENTADLGGGIYEDTMDHLCFMNNTIANNTASQGGGIRSAKDSVSLVNNIVWGNSADIGSQISLPASMTESYTYIEYCDIEFGQDSIRVDSLAILYWGPGNIDTDPLFETGPLGDYHLSMSSPCIDAGNPASEYNDPEDPFSPGYALWPAMGYLRNDMGAFGGGGVDYWLTVEEEEFSPVERELSLRFFPNPLSSSCTVLYQLEEASEVNLSVFDLSGRLVETLVDEFVPSGMYSEHFDSSELCSGMYLIRLTAGGFSTSGRCVIVR